jgi:hypothetical protein
MLTQVFNITFILPTLCIYVRCNGIFALCNLPFTTDKATWWCSTCLLVYNERRKVSPQYGMFAASIPEKVLEIFQRPIFLSAFSSPGVHSASNRRNFVGGKVRPERRADNSAVLVVPNVKVRMEVPYSTPPPPPEASLLVTGKLYLSMKLYFLKMTTNNRWNT